MKVTILRGRITAATIGISNAAKAILEDIKAEVEANAEYAEPWQIVPAAPSPARAPSPPYGGGGGGGVKGVGWKLINNHPQAAVVEYGRARGAKQPPTEAIADWCRRNGIDPSLAFVIARSISRDGIPARYILTNAIARRRIVTTKAAGRVVRL